MLESIAIVLGSILLVSGMIGLMLVGIGAIVVIRLWNRHNMSERIRQAYTRIKWYISGRGFGS